ncbi:MAG TPA: hypothetical protein VFD88_00205 [Clostridia bacterium]|nr:hypothetical protein [Clostridia bacterium]
MSTEALPVHNDVPDPLGLGGNTKGAAVEPQGKLTLPDDRTRGFRLRVASAGIVGLAGLWLAAAFLRDHALHRTVTAFGGPEGVAGTTIHPHPRPSYTLLFLGLSYSIVLLGIVFTTGTHDPFAVRLRIARRRVTKATKEYDRAFARRVLEPLKVEQPHLDLVRRAPRHVDAMHVVAQRRFGDSEDAPS